MFIALVCAVLFSTVFTAVLSIELCTLCSAMNCVVWFVMHGVICYFLFYFVCGVCCSFFYAVLSKLTIMILGAV